MTLSTAALSPINVATAEKALIDKHGAGQKARVQQGLAQVQALWRADVDGDAAALKEFALAQFVVEGPQLDLTFHRLERALEQVDGHFLEIGRELRAPVELDLPAFTPNQPVDDLFAGWDSSAHLLDDFFANKIAFVALLNFPQSTLAERLKNANKLTRRDWAVARLTGRFSRRVPADIVAKQAVVAAAADKYIADYNLWMHHILDEKGNRVFPKDKRLISHWNLRDELKAQYANGGDGANRQRTIVRLMERIVTQTIPGAVVDAPWLDYSPFTGGVVVAPADTVEKKAPGPIPSANVSELKAPKNRYQQLLAQFNAAKASDPFTPKTPTAIARSFELQREIPEERVQKLFLEVLQSPLVPQVAKEIERRLGRKLEPQDLWYDGFKARSSIGEAELDALTKKKYPTAQAYKDDMPRLLMELGFTAEKARWLAERIVVDPARGAGHAMQSARRGDLPHLRTRVEKDGMNYKGYNIAVHEMGHNVEQLFSLYDVDSTLLQGVPNNAFTEAIAFVFQARDLELLGLSKPSVESRREAVLADFWATWEIAGVALVDVAVWHWMYDHPKATPEQLRDATVQIAGDVWKKHYAPVLGGVDAGGKGTPLLGIYSHMIAYPLYLTDYPLGHLIALQIEEQIEKATSSKKATLGQEIERMAKFGATAPDVWMTNASGEPVSSQPLLRATEKALLSLKK
ncbi:MAG: hypothetical protein Q8O67_03955 [Deltaproteobacteria bacterium]|nr:hypothetical protein [Deltaproteobacteria bacterium]